MHIMVILDTLAVFSRKKSDSIGISEPHEK